MKKILLDFIKEKKMPYSVISTSLFYFSKCETVSEIRLISILLLSMKVEGLYPNIKKLIDDLSDFTEEDRFYNIKREDVENDELELATDIKFHFSTPCLFEIIAGILIKLKQSEYFESIKNELIEQLYFENIFEKNIIFYLKNLVNKKIEIYKNFL